MLFAKCRTWGVRSHVVSQIELEIMDKRGRRETTATADGKELTTQRRKEPNRRPRRGKD
jgi:hypothetical protein